MYVRAIRKKQRQGIIVAMVSCLFRIWDGLSAGGMVYSAQIDLKVGDSFEKELSNGPEHRIPEHRM